MSRRAVLVEIAVAIALTCALVVWLSGASMAWLARPMAHLSRTSPVGQYSIDLVDWGAFGRVDALTETGQAAGIVSTYDGGLSAALWDDGETIRHPAPPERLFSAGVGMAADGTFAFNVLTTRGDGAEGYLRTPAGEIVRLSEFVPAASWCTIKDINSSGTVVGVIEGPDGEGRAFVWSPADGMRLLEGQRHTALGINEDGMIVGCDHATNSAGALCAWLPTPDGDYSLIHMSQQSGHEGRAYAVNIDGVAVGRVTGPQPMRWDAANGLQVLDGLGGQTLGWARDINDHGDIVGCLGTVSGGVAVLWRDGKAYDLNRHIPQNHRWTLIDATAINNDGVIACRVITERGPAVAVLTPH